MDIPEQRGSAFSAGISAGVITSVRAKASSAFSHPKPRLHDSPPRTTTTTTTTTFSLGRGSRAGAGWHSCAGSHAVTGG